MVISKFQRYSLIVAVVIFTLVLLHFLYSRRNYFELQSVSQYSCKECQEPALSYARPSSTSKFNRSHDFKVNNLILFPFNNLVQNVDYMLHTKWVQSVQMYLTQLTKKQVIIVSVNEAFLESLLNWLSAIKLHTQIPFSNILILSMDGHVHTSLNKRGISSILLDDDLIFPYTNLHSSFSHIWIKRCTVTRLLNHWGYDVIMMDLDAIILKDPRPLFENFKDSDIIGSSGRYPFDLYRRWGVTLCMGVVMFRSTSAVEVFWETASIVKSNIQDDQVKINNALQYLNIKWFTNSQCKDIKECTVSGVTENNLNVTLLSYDTICRSCDHHHIDQYYIWHQQISRNAATKRYKAKESNVWYLKDNWKDVWQTSHVLGSKLIDLLINQQ